jgi:hypothetical protein
VEAVKAKFVNYKNEIIEHTSQVDTFYLIVKYEGKDELMRKTAAFKVLALSKNLKFLGKDKQGRFKFFIDKSIKMDQCIFRIYLKTTPYVLKAINIKTDKYEYIRKEEVALVSKIVNLY